MKKIILLVLIMIFSSGASNVIARKPNIAPENTAVTATKEDKLSEEELDLITKRVEEISRMDRSNMTVKEKRELRQELREYRDRGYGHRHWRGGIYIGGGTLIIIILLIILLA
jgi:ribosomal protein L19E